MRDARNCPESYGQQDEVHESSMKLNVRNALHRTPIGSAIMKGHGTHEYIHLSNAK